MKTLILATLLTALSGSALSETLPQVDVTKSPYCGCCTDWVKHMKQAGFSVRTTDTEKLDEARQALGMPQRLAACHSAKVGGYAIEGHVPADDIRRLLKQKPKAIGLAVPAMPPGAPGMEGPRKLPYQTLLVHSDGSTEVFAQH